ncbi:MAG TPA: HAMP domain-containing sensor histidine kinase [Rhodothermales bacterium]|nr:HAMP domain-containing sensor histidine kinase [Rhodothermales bacterium]
MNPRLRAPAAWSAPVFRPVLSEWVLVLALSLSLALFGCRDNALPPDLLATGDTIDLRALADGSTVRLTEGWMAQPDDGRLAPDVFRMAVDPFAWRSVRLGSSFRQQRLPAEGTVWYRLRVRLPVGAQPLQGVIEEAGDAFQLYASLPDGQVQTLAESEGQEGARRVLFSLPAVGGEVVLVWRVTQFGTPTVAVQPPLVGRADAVQRVIVRKDAFVFVTVGACVALLLCFGFVWLRQRHNLRVLAFMLLLYVLAMRTLLTGGVLGDLLPGHALGGRMTLEMLSQYLLLGGTGLLVWTLFPLEFAGLRLGRWQFAAPLISATDEATLPGLASRRLRQAHTVAIVAAFALCIVFSALTLLLPTRLLRPVTGAAWGLIALLLPMVLSIAVTAARFRRPGAVLFLVTVVPLVAASAYNIWLGLRGMPLRPMLVTYAYLGLLAAVGIALVQRLAQRAEEAAEANRILAERVTQRSRELQAASIAAQAAGMAKMQFLTAVSHEIRTPLASMLGFSQVLREELTPGLEEHHAEFFDSIQRSGERLMRLVNDLIDLSKVEAGALDVSAEPVDLMGPLRDVVGRLEPIAHEKKLALTLDVPEDVEVRVLGDETRLKQVFYHLVSNAIKFTPEGGVRVEVRSALLRGETAYAVRVEDTGVGISAAFRPHLFDRFVQEERAYAQAGTGLGLALVRELVARMHGTVDVESEEGEGSVFTVTLPAAEEG